MGIMDMLTGKNDKDVFGDLEDQGTAAAQPAIDPSASVQDLYGIGPAAPAAPPQPSAAAPAPPQQPSGQPAPAQQPAAPPAPAAQAPPSPVQPQPAPPTGGDSSDDSLAGGLRELFTESSTIDPQLEALLKKVEAVSASDLANDLKDFAKSIGAERSEQNG